MTKRSKLSPIIRNDPSVPYHSGTLFIQGIPMTTKLTFKAACVRNQETIRDAIIELMRHYVEVSDRRLSRENPRSPK